MTTTIKVWTMPILLAALAGAAFGQASQNSLFQRARSEAHLRQMEGEALGAAGGAGEGRRLDNQHAVSVRDASWLAVSQPTPKGFRVHDLVTIIVNEVSSNSTKAEASTERNTSVDAKLQEWIQLVDGAVRPAGKPYGDPALKFDIDREFESEGDISRRDAVTARIQAEIIDVLPNGNLVLEAVHTVATDEEIVTITLTGICRGKDVNFDNTIQSQLLARLELNKAHQGVARDATKRGWLTGLFDLLNPI